MVAIMGCAEDYYYYVEQFDLYLPKEGKRYVEKFVRSRSYDETRELALRRYEICRKLEAIATEVRVEVGEDGYQHILDTYYDLSKSY